MRCIASRTKIDEDIVIDPDGPHSTVCPRCGRRVQVDAYRNFFNHEEPAAVTAAREVRVNKLFADIERSNKARAELGLD